MGYPESVPPQNQSRQMEGDRNMTTLDQGIVKACIECGDDAVYSLTRIDRRGNPMEPGPTGLCAGCFQEERDPRGRMREFKDVVVLNESEIPRRSVA